MIPDLTFTTESSVHRFADFAIHPLSNRFIVAILEDHTHDTPSEVITTLCVIDSETKTVKTDLVKGADFYAAPSFSPDGTHLVWQQWRFPDMPWDGGEIYAANIVVDSSAGLTLSNQVHVAGKYQEISAGYPTWISKDTILFSTDESGYQNPWIYDISARTPTPVLKTPVDEDFNEPAWSLGGSHNAALDTEGKSVLFTALRDGRSVLYLISLPSGALEEIPSSYVTIKAVRRIADDNVIFIGSKTDESSELVLCSLNAYTKPSFTNKRSNSLDTPRIQKDFLSTPESLTIDVEGSPVYAIYYPPTNPNYVAPEGEKPPCIVNVHGGPTGSDDQSLKLLVQFFTSRGWSW